MSEPLSLDHRGCSSCPVSLSSDLTSERSLSLASFFSESLEFCVNVTSAGFVCDPVSPRPQHCCVLGWMVLGCGVAPLASMHWKPVAPQIVMSRSSDDATCPWLGCDLRGQGLVCC